MGPNGCCKMVSSSLFPRSSRIFCPWISPSSNHNHSPDPAQMHSSDQVGFLFKNIAHCRSTAVLCNQTVFVTSEAHPLQTDVQAHCSFFDRKILEVKRVKKREQPFFALQFPALSSCIGCAHWLWDPYSTHWRKPLQPLALCLRRAWPATQGDWSKREFNQKQKQKTIKDNKRHHNSLEGAKFGRMCAIS